MLVFGITRDQNSKPKCGIIWKLKNPCKTLRYHSTYFGKSNKKQYIEKIQGRSWRYIQLVRNLFYLKSNDVSILRVDNTSPRKIIKHDPYKGVLFNDKLKKYIIIFYVNHWKSKPSIKKFDYEINKIYYKGVLIIRDAYLTMVSKVTHTEILYVHMASLHSCGQSYGSAYLSSIQGHSIGQLHDDDI